MKLRRVFAGVLLGCCVCSAEAGDKKIVIAHRGASGCLPEHSMSAKAVAYAMGADYIEQDVVMTKDDQLVVLHDHFLDQVTNVADVYPGRARKNGRYYAIDFTLDEIRSLKMTERFRVKEGQQSAVFPDRFPLWTSSFRVHTFEEEIELIQGMNASTGNDVGIYPEIKSPAFHRQEGKDISRAVLKVLKKYGYADQADRIYLQCFDAIELERISKKLFPEFGMNLKIIQLIPSPNWNPSDDFAWMFRPGAMERIARYADGVGPELGMIVSPESTRDHLIITDVVKDAHAAGLEIHPYTFRVENVPAYAENFEEMLDIFFDQAGIDGAFTDFPGRMIRYLKSFR